MIEQVASSSLIKAGDLGVFKKMKQVPTLVSRGRTTSTSSLLWLADDASSGKGEEEGSDDASPIRSKRAT